MRLVVRGAPDKARAQALERGITTEAAGVTRHGEALLLCLSESYFQVARWFCEPRSDLLFFKLE